MKDSSDHSTDSDPLDRLLGLTPFQEPDAWFTARTMARCRLSGRSDEQSSFAWAHWWPRWAVTGVFALAVLGVGYQQMHRIHSLHTHHQHRVQEAFEAMANMGQKDSDSSWQDSSLQ